MLRIKCCIFIIPRIVKKCYGDEYAVQNSDVFPEMFDFGRLSVRSFRGHIIGSEPC